MSQSLPGQGDGNTPLITMFEPRTYRQWVTGEDLNAFSVMFDETDLLIRAKSDLSGYAFDLVQKCRAGLMDYILKHPVFVSTLEPFQIEDDAPPVVRSMAAAASAVGVGPMAAVAGAIATELGMGLLQYSDEVIVENGGDIFMKSSRQRLVGVYAGDSPLSGKLAFVIHPDDTPLGICTSSGMVGHSLSFGLADAITVFAPSAALADAAATAIGNLVETVDDVSRAIEYAKHIDGLSGVAIIKGEVLGLWGKIQLKSLS